MPPLVLSPTEQFNIFADAITSGNPLNLINHNKIKMPSLRVETTLFFSTYTNLNWHKVLESDKNKKIILNSLKFLVDEKRIILYGFVIMPNHIHLIWSISHDYKLSEVQRDFLKFTAQQIKFCLIADNDKILDDLVVYSKDRIVQIWERNGLSFMLNSPETTIQKLNYIHNNPIKEKWVLCEKPSD